jgi:hypothetical protein
MRNPEMLIARPLGGFPLQANAAPYAGVLVARAVDGEDAGRIVRTTLKASYGFLAASIRLSWVQRREGA